MIKECMIMEIEEVVVEIVMGLFLLFLSYQVGIK